MQRYESGSGSAIDSRALLPEASLHGCINETPESTISASGQDDAVPPLGSDPALVASTTSRDASVLQTHIHAHGNSIAIGDLRAAYRVPDPSSQGQSKGGATNPDTITFPLEPTPASVSGNLEWDERNASRQSKLNDGMGNLAVGGNDGYLGGLFPLNTLRAIG